MQHPLRRSWLVTPAGNEKRLGLAASSAADVVVLDLVEFVPEQSKAAARRRLASAVGEIAARKSCFAQVDPALLEADLDACVRPGLSGIVISRVETTEQVHKADRLLASLEAARGLPAGSTQIVLALETAPGNHRAHELGKASSRVWGMTLGRADLIMGLRPEPTGELHLMQHLMQRLIIVAGAVGAVPLGAWWRAPDRGMQATPDNTLQAAVRGRAIGFRGAFCVLENQAAPLNQGYSPTAAEQLAAGELLAAYESAVASGQGLVWEGNRLIDRGAALRARHVLDLAAAKGGAS